MARIVYGDDASRFLDLLSEKRRLFYTVTCGKSKFQSRDASCSELFIGLFVAQNLGIDRNQAHRIGLVNHGLHKIFLSNNA